VARRIAAAGPGLRLVRGHARLVGERAIQLAGERHGAAVFVLDVGARPVEPRPLRDMRIRVGGVRYDPVLAPTATSSR
jgi:hypothetical protein